MCARCADLEEQVAFWKSEAGAVNDAGMRARLRQMFRLTAQEGRFLEVLHRHKGRPVSRERMLELIGSDASAPNISSVTVNFIRSKLGKNAIITNWGEGYSIGPSGTAAIEAAQRGELVA